MSLIEEKMKEVEQLLAISSQSRVAPAKEFTVGNEVIYIPYYRLQWRLSEYTTNSRLADKSLSTYLIQSITERYIKNRFLRLGLKFSRSVDECIDRLSSSLTKESKQEILSQLVDKKKLTGYLFSPYSDVRKGALILMEDIGANNE